MESLKNVLGLQSEVDQLNLALPKKKFDRGIWYARPLKILIQWPHIPIF